MPQVDHGDRKRDGKKETGRARRNRRRNRHRRCREQAARAGGHAPEQEAEGEHDRAGIEAFAEDRRVELQRPEARRPRRHGHATHGDAGRASRCTPAINTRAAAAVMSDCSQITATRLLVARSVAARKSGKTGGRTSKCGQRARQQLLNGRVVRLRVDLHARQRHVDQRPRAVQHERHDEDRDAERQGRSREQRAAADPESPRRERTSAERAISAASPTRALSSGVGHRK